MRQLFENSVEDDRFNINGIYINFFSLNLKNTEPFTTLIASLIRLVGNRDAEKIVKSLIRFSFYIEPVKKPKIETTKFAVRWSKELNDDPRFASYEDCFQIFETLFGNLMSELENDNHKQALKLMVNHTNVSYEIPVDYLSSIVTPIHNVENINWCLGSLPATVVKLRQFLTDSSKHIYAPFFRGVYTKINTKTYLTDRVLTGLHKTNREKRWECHPNSVHFALRKVGWEIEYKLIRQVCHFESFPHDLKQLMLQENILEFDDGFVRCPITLEPLSFLLLKNEIENTTHGKSNFQVGHMNPLKADTESGVSGHTPLNISWISEQGNRIQGSNSVDFIRSLIIKIYKNYRASDITDAD